jgi:hypothetical protein
MNKELTDFLQSLRNGGCGRDRNQNFDGQNQRENCKCCNVVRENIDNFLDQQNP